MGERYVFAGAVKGHVGTRCKVWMDGWNPQGGFSVCGQFRPLITERRPTGPWPLNFDRGPGGDGPRLKQQLDLIGTYIFVHIKPTTHIYSYATMQLICYLSHSMSSAVDTRGMFALSQDSRSRQVYPRPSYQATGHRLRCPTYRVI